MTATRISNNQDGLRFDAGMLLHGGLNHASQSLGTVWLVAQLSRPVAG